MKTVSITEARRRLGELMKAAEPVEVTRRGEPLGTLRPSVRQPYDREKAMAAASDIRVLGERLAAKHKPSQKHGATAAVRALRDRGR